MIKKISILIVTFIVLTIIGGIILIDKPERFEPLFKIRSVDTVKYSRDLADEKLKDQQFDGVINKQVEDIATLGVTHIAISTPYDESFIPYLKRWVQAARANKLKVWFRGNFSGWEQWFGYKKIDRETHKKLLESFIVTNQDLFEDGDIFTSCPECENGGPGDPRKSGDVKGFRQFLIDEYKISLESFGKINKKIDVGYYSMNYDVASLVMDKETTKSLGNIVSVDHYIKDPKQVALDAQKIAESSGGKVVLGELGAPIPDIHGDFTEQQQSEWIEQALNGVKNMPEIIGINYWVNVGGSTELWNQQGQPRKAVEVLKKFFTSTRTIHIY